MWFYFFIFFIILFLALIDKGDKKVFFYYSIGLILVLIAGFRSENICRDYSEYRRYFEGIKDSGNIFFLEPTFVLITIFCSKVEWLMLIYATLGVFINLIGIKRLTNLYFYSLLIYFSSSYILHEMTQIRVGVAIAFFLLSIKHIEDRNAYKFIAFVILASLFHYSALIILPLYFIRSKSVNIIFYSFLIPTCYLLHFLGIHFSQLLGILNAGEDIQQKILIQQEAIGLSNEAPKINLFNIVQILKIILIYVLLWKRKVISKNNVYFNILIKIYIFSIAFFILFADIPVFAFRLSEMYGAVEIILVPMLVYILTPKSYAHGLIFLFAFGTICMLILYGELLKPYFN